MQVKPEQICKVIRESFVGAEQVYMNGSCIMFHRILRNIFSKALPYWSADARHCITKIGNKYYDISGEVKCTPDYQLDNVNKHGTYLVAVAFPLNRLQPYRMASKKTAAEF